MRTRTIIMGLLFISVMLLAACTTQTTGKTVAGDVSGPSITVFKSPSCGCCFGHASELENTGYEVKTVQTSNVNAVKNRHSIPQSMWSCHTSEVGGYFVEGHVPIVAIEKLLEERPDIDGISLPNMPAGSPGMPGTKRGTWTIYAIKDGEVNEFMRI